MPAMHMITRGLITGEHSGPQLAHHSLSSDIHQARQSLQTLRNLGRVTMLLGHGRPWTGDIRDAISQAGQVGENC